MANRGGWRTGVGAFALLGLTVAAAACTNDDGGAARSTTTTPVARPAVDQGALHGEGTEIGPGVEVQAGSALVGSAVPLVDPFDDTPPIGWQAVVAVQGDPVAVWNRYAKELHIDDVASATDACVVQAPLSEGLADTSGNQRFLTEPALDGEIRLACHARIGTVTASMAVGLTGCVRPNLGDDPCDLRSGAALYLRSTTEADPDQPAGDELGTDELRTDRAYAALPDSDGEGGGGGKAERVTPLPLDASTTSHPPPAPDPHPGPVAIPEGPIVPPVLGESGPSSLPAAGDRIDDGIDYYLGTDGYTAPVSVLPKGAQSLIAPAMLLDCNSGLVAVVSVPGEPAAALSSFDSEDPGDGSTVRTGEAEGRPWATRSFDSAGGYKLTLTGVGRDDGSTLVIATECGD